MIQYMTIYDFLKPTIRVVELFGGIGACTAALKRIKTIDVEVVDYVEIDKYAVASYNAINGTDFKPQDIKTWDKDLKNIDLIMHGSPCQDFSLAGKGAGGDEGSGTRSSLLYESLRIIEKLKPKYVVWENVKNLLSKKHKHNFVAYLSKMDDFGYKSYYQLLNAKDYGIPQNRERVFTISIRKDIDKGFEFPKPFELKLRLKDMLDDEVDEKYFLTDSQVESIKKSNYTQNKRRIQEKDICDTLCARDWRDPKCVEVTRMYRTEKEHNPQAGRIYSVERILEPNLIQIGNLIGGKWDKINESCRRVYDPNGIAPTIHTCQGGNTEPKIQMITPESVVNRKLTPKECWRLMGFTDEDFNKANKVNSNTQLYKQAGNSIVVKVLEEIFKQLFLIQNKIN